MTGWLARYENASPDGSARYPGQRAAECEAQRSRDGIPLSPALCADLMALGDRVGVPIRLPANTIGRK
jgi:LDH2 family malate/lactate/ureidoglycolate dehydrogenase